MSLTDRDRKIVMILIPLAVLAAYWFLLLAPKREEAASVKDELTTAQSARDDATQKASQLASAKDSFATDYATVIRLGKSIPSNVDMPSLLVQLDRAARGTGIEFTDVKTGERSAAGSTSTPSGGSTTPPPSGGSNPAAAGAPPAQSGPGQAAQGANGAVQSSNKASGQSGLPAGGAAPAGAPGAPGTAPSAPGLESVPLDFEFRGSFFALADFFHRMKRFVRVANDKILIRGRLITINSFAFDTAESFPSIVAKVHATVYLAPKAEGVSAGATPQGPSGATPAGDKPQTASAGSSAPSTPAATVTAP